MRLDQEEQQLLQLLPHGVNHPRPLRELVKLTGWAQGPGHHLPLDCGPPSTNWGHEPKTR